MSISFLAAGAAALAAAVITGILVRRLVRLPLLHMVAWVLAAAGMTIALAAQALGFHHGFTSSTFRAAQIGARLIAPMALAWGLTELVGKSFAARFAGRLALAALTVIAGVILAADPLSGAAFTIAWPVASAHYQLIPTEVLLALGAVTVIWALAALGLAAVRARRRPAWRDGLLPVAAATVAILLTEGLAVQLPLKSGYAALCLAVAALTWFTGVRASRLRLNALHNVPDMGDTGWRDRYTDDTGFAVRDVGDTGWRDRYTDDTGFAVRDVGDTGWQDRYTDDTGFGYQDGSAAARARGDSEFDGLYRPGSGRVGGPDYGDLYRPDTGGFGAVESSEYPRFPDTGDIGSDPGYGFYRTDTDLRPVLNGEVGRRPEPLPGIVETGDILPVAFDVFAPTARTPRDDPTDRLFGQIAIYTLLDGHAEEFDRLAQQVVEKVKALEPDTLAYIVHGVPSAPMQRILYEVYRDSEGYQEHRRQPYIQEFEEGRASLVLATNVIELGVRQAKLSSLGGQDVPPSQPSMAAPAGAGTGPAGKDSGAGPGAGWVPGDPRPSEARPRAGGRSREEPWPPAGDARHHGGSPSRNGTGDQRDLRGQRDPARRGDAGYPRDPARQGGAGNSGGPGRHGDAGHAGDPAGRGDPGWQGDPAGRGDPGWQGDPRPARDPRLARDPLPDVPPLPDDLADHPRLAGRSGVYGRPRPASPPPGPAGRPGDNGSR
jgi:quinol monooxygenase YgiN